MMVTVMFLGPSRVAIEFSICKDPETNPDGDDTARFIVTPETLALLVGTVRSMTEIE